MRIFSYFSLPLKCLIAASLGIWAGGCSKEGGREAYAAQETPANARLKSLDTNGGPREIKDFGPRQVTSGEPFNEQPDGSWAIWLRLDAPVAAIGTIVLLDGVPLKTSSSTDVVTAVVPPERIKALGKHRLTVSVPLPDGRKLESRPAELIVSP
jgi:hypothetical protein